MFEVQSLTIAIDSERVRYKRVFSQIKAEKHRIWWYFWSGENDAYPWEKVEDPKQIKELEVKYRKALLQYAQVQYAKDQPKSNYNETGTA